jgi:hypothetical protein
LRDLDFAACFHFQVPFKHPHSRDQQILLIQALRTVTDVVQDPNLTLDVYSF